LRIVVDYGLADKLILTAVINNKTGEELEPYLLEIAAEGMEVSIPELESMSAQQVRQDLYNTEVKNAEGYVLTWYRPGTTPFRLKVKFPEYLRLHRMVTEVSPKHILEVLQNGWTSDMNAMLDDSTPWFSKFVSKWKRVIEGEFARLEHAANKKFEITKSQLKDYARQFWDKPAEIRKAFAAEFATDPELSGILFAMLNSKDYKQVIWKKIKGSPIMKNGHPMVDAHHI
jgi:RNA ligase